MIATIALLVVGPDKLPAFARQAGKWLGKFRRMVNNLQRELKQELIVDETRGFTQQLTALDDLMKNAPDQDPDFSSKLNRTDEKPDR